MLKKWIFVLLFSLLLASCGKATLPDANIDLSQNNGNKTFVWFVATWCPHCNAEVPVLDSFYKKYKDQVNMQLINTDKKYFNGDFTIPQDIKNPLTYEKATGDKCDYVPSYVIYDENKKLIEKVCGGKITFEQLEAKLLPSQTQTSSGETLSGSTLDTNTDTTMQTEKLKDGDTVAVMTTTNGTLTIKLFPELAPKTVLNFMGLAQSGYYNNITFHRVIKNFMIQWGDPEGTGMGWESIYGSEFEDEFHKNLTNIRGSLSMANAGPGTNGSQFFINQKDNNFLDNKHTVFGQVVEGLDNVDKIANVKTGKNDRPEKDVKIIKIEIKTFEKWALKDKKVDVKAEIKKIEDAKIALQKEQETQEKAKQEKNKNRVVKAWDVIQVHYTGKLASDKSKFDSSYDRGEPIEFEVGAKEMIAGFDAWVVGMKIGEKKTLNIAKADAYGEYDPKNLQDVPREQLADFEKNGIKLEVGAKIPTMMGPLEIKKVTKDTITLDVNHFLAGKDLIFDIELVGFSN